MLYFSSRLYYGTRLFCFINILKIYAFSPIFPLAGSMIGGIGYFFGISRSKAPTVFYGTPSSTLFNHGENSA